ncbi:MAG: response regulator, partial [Gemmataceae bacterium]|nr:response regulator [Gemmataceae bacterium]
GRVAGAANRPAGLRRGVVLMTRHDVVRPRGVLVVDDNEPVRSLLGVALGASGFAVWLAASGPEGLAVYHEHAAAIDLLLLDVRMPGWDGPATLAAIRAVAPHVPCCFMSGHTGEYTERELLTLGAMVVFPKPFRFGELIPFVRNLTAPARGEVDEAAALA